MHEQIALAVAEQNACAYCVAAHSLLRGNAGLGADGIIAARRGGSLDARSQAGLRFARAVVASRGGVADADVERARGRLR